MVQRLKNRLQSICGNDGKEILYPDDNYIAFCMLDEIVKAGMLPPHNGLDYGTSGNEWESENE